MLPALLLLAVALVGVRNHLDHDQSSWEGASLGMFATYDNDVSRVVQIVAHGPAGDVTVTLPADLRDDERRLAVAPSEAAATRLARSAIELADPTVESVTVRLWKPVIDGGDRLRLRFLPDVTGTATR